VLLVNVADVPGAKVPLSPRVPLVNVDSEPGAVNVEVDFSVEKMTEVEVVAAAAKGTSAARVRMAVYFI